MDDLTGGPDDRTRQLAALDAGDLEPAWLRRQLDLALAAWGDGESQLDIVLESREDY